MTTNAQPYGMLTDPRYMDLLAAQQQDAPLPLQKVMQSAPPPPMSGHLVHTLNTADAMGGPVAPDPATIAAAMPPQPKVTQDQDPLHQREGHLTNELNRDYEKDANPWGSPNNHPGIGGKIAHVLSRVGNIAGGILAPSVMANIPGTDLNRRAEEQGLAHQIQEVTGEESRNAAQDANTAHTNAETPEVAPNAESSRALQRAQESNLESETSSRDNPKPSYEIHDTAAGPLFVNKATGTAQHLSVDGTPIGPKIQTKAVQLEIGGKPHQVLVNEADGSLIKDMGESGEKPPVTNVNQGTWTLQNDATTGKPLLFNTKTGETKEAPANLARKPNAEEQKRGDLAQNVNENLDTLEEIVNRRPDLFGPVAGRITKGKEMIGTGDADVGTLKTIEDNLGMAMQSAHGMRSAQHVETSAQSVLNGFKNEPAALLASIKAARNSVGTFQKNVQDTNDAGHPGGGMIRATDDKGVLHEAPAGTALPNGWKAQ